MGIIDYGMGNLGSIANMIRHLGGQAELVAEPGDLGNFRQVILPGVGQFGEAMRRLDSGDWINALELARGRGIWILGICLGMQLLTRFSEEGECPGLGWFDFDTNRISGQTAKGSRRRIPHMGWNQVQFNGETTGALTDASRFYFVHSYCVAVTDDSRCWAATDYEGYSFASAIRDGRILGVQFHPEKSHRYGKTFLRHFMNMGVME